MHVGKQVSSIIIDRSRPFDIAQSLIGISTWAWTGAHVEVRPGIGCSNTGAHLDFSSLCRVLDLCLHLIVVRRGFLLLGGTMSCTVYMHERIHSFASLGKALYSCQRITFIIQFTHILYENWDWWHLPKCNCSHLYSVTAFLHFCWDRCLSVRFVRISCASPSTGRTHPISTWNCVGIGKSNPTERFLSPTLCGPINMHASSDILCYCQLENNGSRSLVEQYYTTPQRLT